MENEDTQPPNEKPQQKTCPHCGATDHIYSKYRDGGSTLYHRDCPVSDKTWPNPEYRFGRR